MDNVSLGANRLRSCTLNNSLGFFRLKYSFGRDVAMSSTMAWSSWMELDLAYIRQASESVLYTRMYLPLNDGIILSRVFLMNAMKMDRYTALYMVFSI